MPRVTLEPVGRFAFLVLGVHAVIGAGLWWWLSHADDEIQGSADQNLVWVSPGDFTNAVEISPANDVTQPSPPAAKPEPAPPAKSAEPSVAAVTPTPKPSAPAPAEEPMEDNLPKAIAIDPAQAAALMARAMAAEKTAPAPVPEPKPATPPIPPPPPAPTTVKKDPPPPPKPVPEPPKPAPAVKPEPAAPAVASSPPSPSPAPQTSDVSRFVTVSHPAPKKVNKDLPKVASLLDIAALDAATTGATGAAKGIRLDEVDRAIIQGFLREWVAPDASKLNLDQRTVSLDVSLDREGRVLNFSLPRHSGSDDLDLSVLEAADRLGKIDIKLPASYPRDVYEFQVNFHVE